MANCGALAVVFWALKIFLGFRIYFFGIPILGIDADRVIAPAFL
jgi:hypothetical protein